MLYLGGGGFGIAKYGKSACAEAGYRKIVDFNVKRKVVGGADKFSAADGISVQAPQGQVCRAGIAVVTLGEYLNFERRNYQVTYENRHNEKSKENLMITNATLGFGDL